MDYKGLEEQTKEVIKGMLTENTGKHFLDSGGAYGRHWQHNQGVDFDSMEPSVLDCRFGYLEITHNVYHWLNEALIYCPEVDKAFHQFAELPENEQEGWLPLISEFIELRHEQGANVLYSDEPIDGVNTYNHDSFLSQVIQYSVYFDEKEQKEICLLQIHGGCDVRGGYTAPRAFELDGSISEWFLLDDSKAGVSCDNDDCRLDGDDSEYQRTNWFFESPSSSLFDGSSCGPGLEDFEILTVEGNEQGRKGSIIYNEVTKETFCPICGKGKLKSYFY